MSFEHLIHKAKEKEMISALSAVQHIALDRDGTINKTKPADTQNLQDTGYVLSPDQWLFEQGADKALAELARLGYGIHLYTQQSAIGKGLLTEEALRNIHTHMQTEVQKLNPDFQIGNIFHCPHSKNAQGGYDCTCAKQKPQNVLHTNKETLLHQLLQKTKAEPYHILAIGDSERDIPSPDLIEAGMIFIGVINPAKKSEAQKIENAGFIVAQNLQEISTMLAALQKQSKSSEDAL